MAREGVRVLPTIHLIEFANLRVEERDARELLSGWQFESLVRQEGIEILLAELHRRLATVIEEAELIEEPSQLGVLGSPHAHTLGLSMITKAKVKTDRRDARTLAKLLRIDAIPKAYIYPKETRRRRKAQRSLNR